jgi:hypothetical protein
MGRERTLPSDAVRIRFGLELPLQVCKENNISKGSLLFSKVEKGKAEQAKQTKDSRKSNMRSLSPKLPPHHQIALIHDPLFPRRRNRVPRREDTDIVRNAQRDGSILQADSTKTQL